MSDSSAEIAQYAIRPGLDGMAARPSIDQYEETLAARRRLTPFCAEMFARARQIRASHEVVMYIAGALTGASEQDKARYQAIAELPRGYQRSGARMFGYVPHLHGTDPIKHPDVSADEVRDVDFLWSTVVSDVQLHFMFPVAHGNAAEATWAEVFGVPVVYLKPANQRLSRLMLGMHHRPRIISYDDFHGDLVPTVERLLAAMEAFLLRSAVTR